MKTQEPCMQEGGSPIQRGIGNGLGACKPVERDGDHAVMGILSEMVSREPSIANADELARGGGAAIEQDAEECRNRLPLYTQRSDERGTSSTWETPAVSR
jgi:hypothetical protein